MSRWFRFYDTAVDDPKVQRLPDALFKTWVNLLCLASKGDGTLASVEDLAFSLRLSGDETSKRLLALEKAGLIDRDEARLRPHNWEKLQFKSDGSTERVKRFRERSNPASGNVSETKNETTHETGPDTDTDTDTDILSDAREARGPDDRIAFRTALCSTYRSAGSMHFPNGAHADIWLAKGYKPEICLAVVSEGLARKPNVPPKYFDGAIADAHAAPVARGSPQASPGKRSALMSAVDSIAKEISREPDRDSKIVDLVASGPGASSYGPSGGAYVQRNRA